MTDCKTCSKCGQVKAVSEFRLFGKQCKKCLNEKSSAWRKANPEKCAELQAAWRKANPEKAAERQAAYRKKNPERCAELEAAWRKANPEKAAEKQAAYRKKNPEKVAAHQKARVLGMSPGYVASCLLLPLSHLSPELLALKREQLTLSRATNQLKKEMKNVE